MPCYDDRDSHRVVYRDTKHNGLSGAQLEAILCGVLTYHGDYDILSKLDWAEIGINESAARAWWKAHQEEDKRRREREAEVRRVNRIKLNALAKLTLEERKALKLK